MVCFVSVNAYIYGKIEKLDENRALKVGGEKEWKQ